MDALLTKDNLFLHTIHPAGNWHSGESWPTYEQISPVSGWNYVLDLEAGGWVLLWGTGICNFDVEWWKYDA